MKIFKENESILREVDYIENIYGDGTAAEKVISILREQAN